MAVSSVGHAVEMAFEGVEPVAPYPPVRGEPLVDLAQRLGLRAVRDRRETASVDEGTARRAATVDAAALYARKRGELVDLVRSLSAEQLERRVPATPGWRVRDAFAHVAGITADLNAGNYGSRAAEDWTAAQVALRRSWTIEEIAAEWEHESVTFEEGLRLFGYELGSHYVADLHAHSQDVRAALGMDADRDPLTVLVALDFYVDSTDTALRETDVGAVEIVAGDEHHVVGRGPAVATVRAPPFEVLRVLSGRRSRRQIEAMEWTGERDRFVASLSRYPLPEDDLVD
jgi:uncharacterized protein (TIGR03083 family)